LGTPKIPRPCSFNTFLGSFCRCDLLPAAVCLSSMAAPPIAATQARASQVRRVVRVAAGNALEMYDFQIFAYYAAAIAITFFPSSNEYASLMLSARDLRRGIPHASPRSHRPGRLYRPSRPA